MNSCFRLTSASPWPISGNRPAAVGTDAISWRPCMNPPRSGRRDVHSAISFSSAWPAQVGFGVSFVGGDVGSPTAEVGLSIEAECPIQLPDELDSGWVSRRGEHRESSPGRVGRAPHFGTDPVRCDAVHEDVVLTMLR